jgi:UDP-N-acetyl-D-glucosamine dehydrogenase
VLGVAYKAGTSDMRESPALKILELLRDRGADVSYHDAFVPALSDHGLRSVDLDKALDGTDLATIVTAHPGVDHAAIAERAPITVDFRGVTRAARGAAVHQL